MPQGDPYRLAAAAIATEPGYPEADATLPGRAMHEDDGQGLPPHHGVGCLRPADQPTVQIPDIGMLPL
jgi:hypothetical protein